MKLAIFGTSGFARETRDVAAAVGYDEIIYLEAGWEPPIGGFPVLAEEEAPPLAREGFAFVIGIGNPRTRKAVWERFPALPYVNLIHPSATFGFGQRERFRKRCGNIVTAGVRFTNGITVGNFGIYNLNCTVGHDCIIGDFVTLSPGANLSGNVSLGEEVYIGTNACVLQGRSEHEKLSVGRGATVGAGAVVTKNVPDHIIVKGIPAK